MELNEFLKCFARELEETPAEEVTPQTVYKDLAQWDSLVSLSIISMVDDQLDKEITSADLRSCNTIEELYKRVKTLS